MKWNYFLLILTFPILSSAEAKDCANCNQIQPSLNIFDIEKIPNLEKPLQKIKPKSKMVCELNDERLNKKMLEAHNEGYTKFSSLIGKTNIKKVTIDLCVLAMLDSKKSNPAVIQSKVVCGYDMLINSKIREAYEAGFVSVSKPVSDTNKHGVTVETCVLASRSDKKITSPALIVCDDPDSFDKKINEFMDKGYNDFSEPIGNKNIKDVTTELCVTASKISN